MQDSILPLDNFVVINKSILNEEDHLNLILLYQPIIGSLAVSLYFTLWGYLDKNKINSKGNSHNDLVLNMQIKLEDIKEAREKLEAIGLIKTYLKKGEVNSYIYELYTPLSAFEFLNNPILNTALYNNLNKAEYKRIVENYTLPKIDLKDYVDISCSFKDVYNFVASAKQENKNIKKASHLDLPFEPNIEFNELLALIPEEILNVSSITKTIKDLIYKLAFIYNFNNDIMSEIIKNSTQNRKIDVDKLKENCREYYKFENKGKIPKLIYNSQPLYLRQEKIENTKEDKIISVFETTTPIEFLESKQESRPTETDVQTLEDLMLNKGLTPGVVNVLVDYVLKINNNKLNKKFVEQIAVQWKRSNILTVKDAIEFARNEYDLKNNKKVFKEKTRSVPSWVGKEIKDEYLSDEELEKFEKKLRGEAID
jgi:replication initiation and membrane attachment protein